MILQAATRSLHLRKRVSVHAAGNTSELFKLAAPAVHQAQGFAGGGYSGSSKDLVWRAALTFAPVPSDDNGT